MDVSNCPPGSKDTRYNFRVNSEHKLFKDILKVGEQVSFVYKMNNGISVGNQYNNTLRGAFGTSPIAPVYSDNNLYDSPYNDTFGSFGASQSFGGSSEFGGDSDEPEF